MSDPKEERAKAIVELYAWRDGEIELDESTDTLAEVVSEGDANGAYVRAWVWVDFAGTELDKELEE